MNKFKTLGVLLNKKEVPTETKEMINTLNEQGKSALNDFYDENSDFYQHAEPSILANKLSLDPTVSDFMIYHYTNVESFQKIAESKEFYIKSIYYENDPEEVTYTYQLAERELSRLGAPEEVCSIFSQMVKSQTFDHYVWSFSLNPASQALQNYGDIALGFSAKELGNHINHIRENGFTLLINIIYDEKIQLKYIRPIMRQWWYAYQNIYIDPDDMMKIIISCFGVLSFLSICFKNHRLYQEEEIRFVFMNINDDNQLHFDKTVNGNPIIALRLEPTLLKELIVTHKADKKIDQIKKILVDNNYDKTKIIPTQLPY